MVTKRRRVVLHIGVEKTGTTSIQEFLASNTSCLRERGFWVPNSLGQLNHVAICCLAQRDIPKFRTVWNLLGITNETSRQDFVSRTLIEFRNEIASLPDNIHTVLISNEHVHSNLTEGEEIRRLHELLDSFFQETCILVYLRRQDELATSLYSTRIKGGEMLEPEIFPTIGDHLPYYFDYHQILTNFSGVFGRSSIVARIFERSKLLDGNVVNDYAASVGIALDETFKVPNRLNESISYPAMFALSLINPYVPCFIDSRWNNKRNYLVETLEEKFNSKSGLGSQAEAKAFYELFRNSNELVRAEFLPEMQAPMFSESFDEYPITRAPVPSYSEVGEVFACLWNNQAELRIELRQKLEAKLASQRH